MNEPFPIDAGPPSIAKPVATGLGIVLRVAQVILAAAVLVMIVFGALLLLTDMPVNGLLDGPDGMRPSRLQFALGAFASAITAAAWFWVLHMLVKIVRTVQVGEPFVEANIGRLRGMWILIAVTELFRMFVYSALDMALSGTSASTSETGLDIRIGTWFLVLVVAVLSEAFRQGAEMRREQELTI